MGNWEPGSDERWEGTVNEFGLDTGWGKGGNQTEDKLSVAAISLVLPSGKGQ
jgi:hypothetical protein